MENIRKDDIIIRMIGMEPKVHGFVHEDESNNYNVYINDKLAPDKVKETLKHELNHIYNGDLTSDEDITGLE